MLAKTVVMGVEAARANRGGDEALFDLRGRIVIAYGRGKSRVRVYPAIIAEITQAVTVTTIAELDGKTRAYRAGAQHILI